MALNWKLYTRDKKLLAATAYPEEMAMLLAARGIVGDTVKFRGLVCLRVKDEFDARRINLSIDDTTSRLWDTWRAKQDAKIARYKALCAKHEAKALEGATLVGVVKVSLP